MPVKTGIQKAWKSWIPDRAGYRQLARNDVQVLLRTSEPGHYDLRIKTRIKLGQELERIETLLLKR